MRIFIVNMKRSTDRRQAMQMQMDKHQINFEFIDAVDGNNLSTEQLNRVDKKKVRRRLSRDLLTGEIGCALSHANIYQKMVDEKISDAIILEDDAIITEDFVKCVKQSKFTVLDYDFLHLYSNKATHKKIDSFDDYQIYNTLMNPDGTVAYYLNNKMAFGLRQASKTITYVADYPINLNRIGNVAVIKPDIVKTSTEDSLIWKGNRGDSSKKWNRIKRYSCVECFFNRQDYNNLTQCVYNIYSNLVFRLVRNITRPIKLMIILLVGKFIRNNNKVFIASAQNRLTGNCKYAMRAIQQKFPDKKIYWTVNIKEFPAQIHTHNCIILERGSWLEKWHLLTAAYVISDGHFYGNWFAFGAVNIDFWHGIPIKYIGILYAPLNTLTNKIKWHIVHIPMLLDKKNYHLCCSSVFLVKHMEQVNGYKKGIGKKLNNPIISPMVNQSVCDMEIANNEKLSSLQQILKPFDKVYLYAPTYRDLGGNFLEALNFDLTKLQSALQKTNSVLLLRFHPLSNIIAPIVDNVIHINNDIETEIVIAMSDIIITDYSSIYFNALAGGKDVLLMHGDIKKYQQGRGIDMSIFKDLQAEKIEDFEDLEGFIINNKLPIKVPQKLIQKYWDKDSLENPNAFLSLMN